MKLETKPDFEAAQNQWELFWQHKSPRPMIRGQILKPGKEPVKKPPYASGHDGNFQPVIDQLLKWADAYEFVGEAIPFFYLEFAADHFSSLLGVELEFHEGQQGGWPVHCMEDIDDADIRFRPECKWWERTVEFAQALKKDLDGKILIASPTLVANLDALAAMRGPQNLIFDLMDKPDSVKRALDQITAAHKEVLDAFAELFEFDKWGSINRHGLYTKGAINVAQCDISAMLSPDMFEEFAFPYIETEFSRYSGGEYHLDGPEAIKHLEMLCQLKRLDVVQWIAGSGEAAEKDWTWLYEKIDRLGKGQWRGGSIDQVRKMIQEYDSRQLVLNVENASRSEIEDLIDFSLN